MIWRTWRTRYVSLENTTSRTMIIDDMYHMLYLCLEYTNMKNDGMMICQTLRTRFLSLCKTKTWRTMIIDDISDIDMVFFLEETQMKNDDHRWYVERLKHSYIYVKQLHKWQWSLMIRQTITTHYWTLEDTNMNNDHH